MISAPDLTSVPAPVLGAVFAASRPKLPPGAPCRPVVSVRTRTDLDVVSEDAARGELSAICADADPEALIVVRLGPDRFVDVRGLDVLVSAACAAADDGRRLLVVDPPHTVLRMLEALESVGMGLPGLVPDQDGTRTTERTTS